MNKLEKFARAVIEADNRFYDAVDNGDTAGRRQASRDLNAVYANARSNGFSEQDVLDVVYRIDEEEGI